MNNAPALRQTGGEVTAYLMPTGISPPSGDCTTDPSQLPPSPIIVRRLGVELPYQPIETDNSGGVAIVIARMVPPNYQQAGAAEVSVYLRTASGSGPGLADWTYYDPQSRGAVVFESGEWRHLGISDGNEDSPHQFLPGSWAAGFRPVSIAVTISSDYDEGSTYLGGAPAIQVDFGDYYPGSIETVADCYAAGTYELSIDLSGADSDLISLKIWIGAADGSGDYDGKTNRPWRITNIVFS